MSPRRVVEALDVVEDIRPCFFSSPVDLASGSLGFQAAKEALHCRVVPNFTGPAHAASNALLSQETLEVLTGVLGGFNRSSQHRVGEQILSNHSVPRPVSSSRAFSGVWCSARGQRLRSVERSNA